MTEVSSEELITQTAAIASDLMHKNGQLVQLGEWGGLITRTPEYDSPDSQMEGSTNIYWNDLNHKLSWSIRTRRPEDIRLIADYLERLEVEDEFLASFKSMADLPTLSSSSSLPDPGTYLNTSKTGIRFDIGPVVRLTVPFDGLNLTKQLEVVAAIYADTRDYKDNPDINNGKALAKKRFIEWAATSLTKLAGQKELLLKYHQDFAQPVQEAVLADDRFADLSERLTDSEDQTPGTREVMANVRRTNLENMLSNMEGHLKDLYILSSSMIEKGSGDEVIPIPGTDVVITANDLLSMTFWNDKFYSIIENLLVSDSVDLIHNSGIWSISNILKEGVGGKRERAQHEDALEKDILGPILREQKDIPLTYSVPGLPHKLYLIGASQGGGEVQFRFSGQALSPRTIFFPYDTGHPDAMLDINDNGAYEARKRKVMDIVGATGLLLVRHVNYMIAQYLDKGSFAEEESKQLSGHFQLLEGNTLGNISINNQTTKGIRVPIKEKEYNAQQPNKEETIRRIKEWNVPVVES